MGDTQATLAQMLSANKFEPYIRYIRFPEFRNLRENTQIDFLHPVTALVGPNGTNKTAILRALQGCPDYENLGLHWFSTDLDPIEEGARHRFIHGYIAPSQNQIVEVIKTRIERGENPDYFEPSRPILKDGMPRMPRIQPGEALPPDRTKTRWKAIVKSVIYLDFRSELSAFDKYWFHVPYNKRITSLTEKKALIRRRSAFLARALESGTREFVLWRRQRVIEAAHDLVDTQVAAISEILGREYESVRIITHKFFDVEGSSVVLRSRHLRYSEAFAGSGEFAVSMLVKAVTGAPDYSLVLLDEPETSLHPGAQRKLVQFLSGQAKIKRLQIILSTHAPEIVRDLPSVAIKVLQSSPADGKVQLVSQSSNAAEAFFRLGAKVGEQVVVYVEDGLAAAIIQRAIRPLGEVQNSLIRLSPLPGGAGAIQTRFIPSFAQSANIRCLVFLDGDQQPACPVSNASDVSDAQLQEVLEGLLGGTPQIAVDGSGGTSPENERCKQYRRILVWILTNVAYLPGSAPETLLLKLEEFDTADEITPDEAKEEWVARTKKALGRQEWETVSSAEILGEQERALAGLDQHSSELTSIRDRINQFIEVNEGREPR